MIDKKETENKMQHKDYELIEKRYIPELSSEGTVLVHKKSGARVFLMENDDVNKVFMIGFRTTPDNSKGTPHIMEHSVLCGSEKFPIKDPFVELAKGSLNTFLNAMTYPDKTVYPVASCNDKDFKNLMGVYMDAVLFPNIYKEKKIFEQEGWHYELEDKDGELKYNGVVYNEMKGAFSSPESVLERYTMNSLFPDTTYGNESGGDPDCIPELDFEEFKEFHRRYYHPSNSYIWLYGKMDMEERLDWLSENYLNRFDKEEINSEIGYQKPFDKTRELGISYPIGENEPSEKHCYLSKSFVIEDDLDPKLYIAFQILEYALLDAPGAPLKEALLEAGIGEDIFGGYTSGIKQPYFSVTAKNTDEELRESFLNIITEKLRELSEGGLDRKAILAGLNFYEFKYREADYGRLPKGLMYGLIALDSWLYDGSPYTHLFFDESFSYLKKKVDDGYFEELIKKYLVDNSFSCVITVKPERGLTKKRDEELSEKLRKIKESMSDEELSEIIRETKELKEYQDAPDSPEDIKKLPVLSIKDIEKKASGVNYRVVGADNGSYNGPDIIFTEENTNGIAYIKALFDLSGLSTEELCYASFLKSVLAYTDTKSHSYKDLASEILLNSGGLDFDISAYPCHREGDSAIKEVFSAEIRVLFEKLDFGFDIISEVLTETVYTDEKRISDILAETRSRVRMRLEGASHSVAATRAGSYFSEISRFSDLTDGIAYYEFLDKAMADFKEGKGAKFCGKLEDTAKKVFAKDNLKLSLCSAAELLTYFEEKAGELKDSLFEPAKAGNEATEGEARTSNVSPIGKLNEGFKTTSQVSYVAVSGSFGEKGLLYTGALQVLRILLNYDYLWQNLRVKGGAYGCMSGFARSGKAYLVSYRDPNVKETLDVYRALPAYLRETEFDDETIAKYIIGAISDLDMPLTMSSKAQRGVNAYLSGITDEMLQRERDEVLSADKAVIKGLADYIDAMISEDAICAIGNSGKLEESRDEFKTVKDLF